MAIEKYGRVLNCGYGVYIQKRVFPFFVTNIVIFTWSEIASKTSAKIEGFPEIIESSEYYVVFDNETKTWREYFTGLTVDLVKPIFDEYGHVEYNVNTSTFSGHNNGKVCRSLSVGGDIYEMNAADFSHDVARYSDEEIKEMVSKIFEMNEQAKKWSAAFDKAVQEVIDERARKESGASEIEANLAAGLGKFGNEHTGTGYTQEKNTTSAPPTENTYTTVDIQKKSTSKASPTDKEMLNWTKQGRCSHCGGVFKGLFSKVCRECGAPKDY